MADGGIRTFDVSELDLSGAPRSHETEPYIDYHEDSWDVERCVQEFAAILLHPGANGFDAAMNSMDRLGCWRRTVTGQRSTQFGGCGSAAVGAG
jgi:hypothetical protein